jgi:transglutaminase-like putative cysteine protease
MRYLIRHETHLSYPSFVREHQCELRLKPRKDPHQTVHRFNLEVDPKAEIFQYTDSFGNDVHHFGILQRHSSLVTRMEAEVETFLENPFDYLPLSPDEERNLLKQGLRENPSLYRFLLHRSPMVSDLKRIPIAGLSWPRYREDAPLQESLLEAMRWIREHFTYRTGATQVHAPLKEFLKKREGVCQDFSHLMIALVRNWGFPSRYVMGYQQAAQATHAWTEIFVPGIGWRGMDATHALMVNDTYIAVAMGRDSEDAAPQRGSYQGTGSESGPHVNLQVITTQ